MKINIETPVMLCEYANKVVTSWKLTYMGQVFKEGIYYYVLTHKENNRIKIGVEILSELEQLEQLYNPESFEKLDNEWVKIYCKDLNVPQKRGCTKFIRVEEFKEVRRVFNAIHNSGRQLIQI